MLLSLLWRLVRGLEREHVLGADSEHGLSRSMANSGPNSKESENLRLKALKKQSTDEPAIPLSERGPRSEQLWSNTGWDMLNQLNPDQNRTLK